MATLLTLAVLILAGARVRDGMRLRQQELILAKLPEAEAIAYYEVLRKRVRNTRMLRAVALISLLVLIRAWKHGLFKALISS